MRRETGWMYVPTLAMFLVTLLGCSTSPTNRFTLFPQQDVLIDEAKDIRDAAKGQTLPLPRELEKVVQKPYTVEPGDVLLVQPADLDSPVRLPADQPILPDGTIHLGRYGQIVVAGKTVPEIEALVQAIIQEKVKDVGPIVVRIVTRVSKVYYVLGEVNAPGAFPLQGREAVLDGIIAAGGLSARASRCNIILSRPSRPSACRVVLPVSYTKIVQLGDTTTNYQLAPGDRIYVGSRSFLENLTNCCCGRSKDCDANPQVPCPLPPPPFAEEHPELEEVVTPPTPPALPKVLPMPSWRKDLEPSPKK